MQKLFNINCRRIQKKQIVKLYVKIILGCSMAVIFPTAGLIELQNSTKIIPNCQIYNYQAAAEAASCSAYTRGPFVNTDSGRTLTEHIKQIKHDYKRKNLVFLFKDILPTQSHP